MSTQWNELSSTHPHLILTILSYIVDHNHSPDANSLTRVIAITPQDLDRVRLNQALAQRYRGVITKLTKLAYFKTIYPTHFTYLEPYLDHTFEPWAITKKDQYSSLLVDAVSTGLRFPYAKCTHDIITPRIEQDIVDMVELFPEMVQCTEGRLRCRDEVTPLYFACINNFSIQTLETIARQHRRLNVVNTINVNNEAVSIRTDLEYHFNGTNQTRLQRVYDIIYD